MQFKTRNELIPAIMQLFAENPEAHVMVIVDPDAGPEVLQTHPSRIWSFGLLAAAEKDTRRGISGGVFGASAKVTQPAA